MKNVYLYRTLNGFRPQLIGEVSVEQALRAMDKHHECFAVDPTNGNILHGYALEVGVDEVEYTEYSTDKEQLEFTEKVLQKMGYHTRLTEIGG